MPFHPRAKELFKSGLYSGLSAFDELESRIAALGENKAKGDAFEVFAEAYLATQRKHDADKVWPLSATPLEVLRKLGLSEQDYGVDGVFLTLLGHHNAYQVKYRSARSPLTWRELSTFTGLADSPHIRSRILITNCDELPDVLNERQGFFCIRGSDLDRLQPEDFQAIESWLAESAFELPKKRPQEHQTEALAALVPALKTESRVSAIMACGTGKTLVALWVAEQIQASRILVLLPSLALLRQTLHEWLRETNLPALAYLCVCSDPTVTEGADALATRQSDLDFEVKTDPANVRQFLDAPFVGTKVVFSTYQSASVVGQAMKPGESFDLGIFDEAHKTAGREGRNYGFALDDSNIPIQKRLFVTATPRHYNPHKRDQEGEAQVVFSMDNPQVYGRQAFCLTFGEAARRGIICNYKVLISVITSEMVTNELLSRGDVIVNGDAVRARQVANQIALRDAVEKYGVSKIFTFHKTVKSAASFVAEGSEGIRTHLPGFGSFHVNGDMPTARRERVMREFRGAAHAVMSNARCLTEGVDVPAVDMVAFLSPRRSRVDIVQATGRAMRRAPGKTLGYVLVPLYVELAAGESVDDAVSRADFDEVWDILQSLQEQDDALTELIRYASELKGRGKGFDDKPFSDKIDFGGPKLELDTLKASVATQCLEKLITPWDYWIGKLKSFRERFGHSNVSQGLENDRSFLSWVNGIRTKFGKGLLSRSQIQQLNFLGFFWSARARRKQDKGYRLLKFLRKYKEKHGDCNVPVDYMDNPRLGRWVASVRRRKSTGGGSVTEDLVNSLNELGFVWDYKDPVVAKFSKAWLQKLERLRKFKERFGHCNVETGRDEDPSLGGWVSAQRTRRKKGTLTDEQVARLDGLGFAWDWQTVKGDETWMRWYRELENYTRIHGNSQVPRTHANTKLANWVWIQRQRKKGTLKRNGTVDAMTAGQGALLDKLGFRLDAREEKWVERLEELKKFKAQHGHCEVGSVTDADDDVLNWVRVQRSMQANGKMEAERKEELDALGFLWSRETTERRWDEMYQRLKAYHAQHGSADIPHVWKEDLKLAAWVGQQRQRRKKQLISDEQIELLDALGFTWQHRERGSWEGNLAKVLAFKEKYGHCNISVSDAELGGFVNTMRVQKKNRTLSAERITKLDAVGFVWAGGRKMTVDGLTEIWKTRCDELVHYKGNHGDYNVPSEWSDNPQLGHWVCHQRQQRKAGVLHPERQRLLDEIGFDWHSEIRKEDWATRFEELKAYKQRFGHCRVPVKWPENPQLGNWVTNLRHRQKTGKLPPEKEELLREVGFE